MYTHTFDTCLTLKSIFYLYSGGVQDVRKSVQGGYSSS